MFLPVIIDEGIVVTNSGVERVGLQIVLDDRVQQNLNQRVARLFLLAMGQG